MYPSKLSDILQRTLFGLLLGIMYALATGVDRRFIPAGALVGLLVGLLTGILDKWVFTGNFRRLPFGWSLLIRTGSYISVIISSLVIAGGLFVSWKERMSLEELYDVSELKKWIKSGTFIGPVLFAFVLLLFSQFVTLVSRLLGRNVLLNYLLGRYYSPKEEERIFMFIDIKSSTQMAEKLGHFKWHKLLNDFFFDIAEPIQRCKGEIYQYVGDEVVISWQKRRGLENLNCIHCFFYIDQKIKSKRQLYLKRYGFEPVFKAGYHIGKVVAGEIGDYKREIVFHGDTINTASRIQAETNTIGRRLLFSGELLRELELGNEFKEEYIGSIKLRGKEQEITLYSLDPVYIFE